MQPLRIKVEIVMERVPLASRWASEAWQPFAVLPVDDDAPDSQVREPKADATGARWSFRGHTLELHPTEAEGYFLNMTSPAPCVFVMWRLSDDVEPPPARPVLATLSYNQAGRLLDGGERVDPVPMPPTVLDWMRPFVALHYKPEPKRKVKRNDPFADGAFIRERRGDGSGNR
jgi:hypothetical protein